MPIFGRIPANRTLACDCMGGACDSVRFEPGALEIPQDMLAITGRADQVAASRRAGSLRIERRAGGIDWIIEDDAPLTPALENLRALLAARTAIYGRPLIDDAGSLFDDDGPTRVYSAATIRALLIKPIIDAERAMGWEPIREDLMEEFRFCEFRAMDDGLVGTVIRYGNEARFGDFTEVFEPGALQYDDVIVNLQHDRARPVARTGAGLELRDNAASLEARIVLPDTSYAREARELVAARILRGFSMEFRAVDEQWEGSRRTVRAARLLGIGIVDRPAYSDSRIARRFEMAHAPRPTMRYWY